MSSPPHRPDPAIEAIMDQAALADLPPYNQMPVKEARAIVRGTILAMSHPSESSVQVEDLDMDGRMVIRLFRPGDAPPGTEIPLLMFYHGGGWVLGDLDTYHPLCAELCFRSGVAVAAVDYRLAPEHPFPAAANDAIDAARWLAARAPSYGLDAKRIGLCGDSAGGNLAAVVANALKGDGEIRPRGMFLFYPATDLSREYGSYERNGAGYLLSAPDMRWFRSSYLGTNFSDDPLASPLLSKDLSGLPPTYVLTCGFDPLCDDGMAYARALRDAGNDVLHDHRSDKVHGYLSWTKAVPSASETLRQIADLVRNWLS